jgi:hypothetical protein
MRFEDGQARSFGCTAYLGPNTSVSASEFIILIFDD